MSVFTVTSPENETSVEFTSETACSVLSKDVGSRCGVQAGLELESSDPPASVFQVSRSPESLPVFCFVLVLFSEISAMWS